MDWIYWSRCINLWARIGLEIVSRLDRLDRLDKLDRLDILEFG